MPSIALVERFYFCEDLRNTEEWLGRKAVMGVAVG
jgi:hypothetical protein